jgi:hypothetical protein
MISQYVPRPSSSNVMDPSPGSTAVLGEDRVPVSGRSQYGILGGHWDVTFCNPGVTPVMDI